MLWRFALLWSMSLEFVPFHYCFLVENHQRCAKLWSVFVSNFVLISKSPPKKRAKKIQTQRLVAFFSGRQRWVVGRLVQRAPTVSSQRSLVLSFCCSLFRCGGMFFEIHCGSLCAETGQGTWCIFSTSCRFGYLIAELWIERVGPIRQEKRMYKTDIEFLDV